MRKRLAGVKERKSTEGAGGPGSGIGDPGWRGIYAAGAVAALGGVALVLLDTLVSVLLPYGEAEPGARTVSEWYALLADDPFYGMRDLGLLNVLNIALGIPLLLALYGAHRRTTGAFAALALVLFAFGGAIYVSNNAAIPMLVLSGEHAAATSDGERAALAAAGEAVLAGGADFTPGSLPGFVLTALGQIFMSLVMLHDGVFGRATAYAGCLGFSLLLCFAVWMTLVPGALGAAMLIAAPAGLLVVVWNVLVAKKLFGLAGGRGKERHTNVAKQRAPREENER